MDNCEVPLWVWKINIHSSPLLRSCIRVLTRLGMDLGAETVSWNLSASKKSSLKRELPKRTAKKGNEGCWHSSSPSYLQITGFRNHLIDVHAG